MSSQYKPAPGNLVFIARPDSQPDASEEACGRHIITMIRGNQFKVDGSTGWFDASWIGNSLEGFVCGVDDRRFEADDRTLLALGERLAVAQASEVSAKAKADMLHETWSSELHRLGLTDDDAPVSKLRALREKQQEVSIATGHHDASETWNSVACDVALLCQAIAMLPANTISGLAVKGRAMLRNDLQVDCDATLDTEPDYGTKCTMHFVSEIEQVAAMAGNSPPTGFPTLPDMDMAGLTSEDLVDLARAMSKIGDTIDRQTEHGPFVGPSATHLGMTDNTALGEVADVLKKWCWSQRRLAHAKLAETPGARPDEEDTRVRELIACAARDGDDLADIAAMAAKFAAEEKVARS